MKRFEKTPEGVLDYGFDWSTWLETGDIVSASSWVADTGITVDSNTFSDTESTAFLSGGDSYKSYCITNTIITADGRTTSRTVWVDVVPKRFER